MSVPIPNKMITCLQQAGYLFDCNHNIYSRPAYQGIAYNDGDEIETRIGLSIRQAKDISVLSTELRHRCTDWASLYHLSSARANILRPFKDLLNGDILEIGAGCGAITRYLGECGGNVLSIEGSHRRAAIARDRTRDLENVTVLAEKFDIFKCDHKFDVITLIGVLEYANLFNSGDQPALELLKKAKKLLKPEGKLIIAIENQFGLKYFAGVPEDHLGIPMYGIEGRYLPIQPQTFGKETLSKMLVNAGFTTTEFLAPFPDYKFPLSIVRENAVGEENFDASALAWQNVHRDPQIPQYISFSIELAWPDVFKNKLAFDLSNSFLLISSPVRNTFFKTGTLAFHYSTERIPFFCKETRFVRDENSEINVFCSSLSDNRGTHPPNNLISYELPATVPYVLGHPLSLDLIRIVTRDGWVISDVTKFFNRYINLVWKISASKNISLVFSKGEVYLPGEFFDLVPQNIIIKQDNSYEVIDKEWVFTKDVTLSRLVFRSVLCLIGSITRFGWCGGVTPITRLDFLRDIFFELGFSFGEQDILRFLDDEAAIQEIVTGRSAIDDYKLWPIVKLKTLSLGAATLLKESEIADLGQAAAQREAVIADLGQAAAQREAVIADLGQAAAQREAVIADLGQAAAQREAVIADLSQAAIQNHVKLANINQAVTQGDVKIANLSQIVCDNKASITDLQNHLQEQTSFAQKRAGELDSIRKSFSWKITKPARVIGGFLLFLISGIASLFWRIFRKIYSFIPIPIKYRIKFSAFLFRLFPIVFKNTSEFITWKSACNDKNNTPPQLILRDAPIPIVILTTHHCDFVAHSIKTALKQAGIQSDIIYERPLNGFSDVPHFVICPQMFSQLPGMYVAFQMEQSISSRWFNEDYFKRLENSFAILDYSTENIAFLQKNGLSMKQIYYQPLGYVHNYSASENTRKITTDKMYDILFYGDINNERRKVFIESLNNYFTVKVVNNIFGKDLHTEIERARVVVNIHYYAGALLETTRIWESLSLNKLVISERSSDRNEHIELENIVDFVDVDDVQGMIERVRFWLSNEDKRLQKIQENKLFLEKINSRFEYYFHRFLLATDNITFDEFWKLTGHKVTLENNKLCLNLPESVERRADFNKDNHYGFILFPGLRHSQGWIGCAMSYKLMLMLARRHNFENIIICEDDVEFPFDFHERLADLEMHLKSDKVDWDIFSGILSNLKEDAAVLGIYKHKGQQYAVVNRLISMVFNIYHQRVFDTIAQWDPSDRDVVSNTIDRYLEANASLRVLTTCPFLVGHKEDLVSSIWGFKNTQYLDLIAASGKLLKKKVDQFSALVHKSPAGTRIATRVTSGVE